MTTEVQLDGTLYRLIKDQWYDTTTFIRVPQALSRRLDVRLQRTAEVSLEPEPAPKRRSKKAKRKSKRNVRGFRQEDALPIIASIIRKRNKKTNSIVTHHEIVDAILDHPKGRELAEKAVERKGHTVKKWASWMVQAFSQKMSSDDCAYHDEFERDRVDGAWAYRTV